MPRDYKNSPSVKKTGLRLDNRDLTREWVEKYPHAAHIWNNWQFQHLDPQSVDHLLALFNDSHMHYDRERDPGPHGEPSLADMTEKALEILSRNEEGYFLMVEGGRIDHAHHDGNAYHALHEGVALNHAVARALELTDAKETLILVTADHSHTLSFAGYPTRGNPILGKVIGNDKHGNPKTILELADDGKPYAALGYYTSPTAMGKDGRRDLTNIDTEISSFYQQAAILFHVGRHGGEDVAIYANGPGAGRVHGVMEQNEIYNVIFQALWPDK